MIFKPNIIVFMQRNGILVAGRRIKPAKFALTDDLTHNLEVQNRTKLVDTCQQFFTANGLHGKRVLLVLDYSVVFEKAIKLDQSGQPDKLLDGFLQAMPFAAGQRACVGIETGSELRLFATNAALYEAVADALRATGVSSISAITPIAAYNLADTERTLSAAAERILRDGATEKQANFQDVVPA